MKTLLHLRTPVLAAGFSLLAGCGGGGGSSSATSTDDTSSFEVTGTAIKGLMIDADIRAYDFSTNQLIAETTTNTNGQYSFEELNTQASLIKVVMTTHSDTKTKCDSADGCLGASVEFGATYSFHDPDFEMTALLTAGADTEQLMVTPITHLAAERVAKEGVTSQSDIESINNATAALFGLVNIDITTQLPSDLTSESAAEDSADSLKYGAILAGIATSAAQKDISITEALNRLTNQYVTASGITGHSSDEITIDLADILSGAQDAINTAEQALNTDLDTGVETALLAQEHQALAADADTLVEAELGETPTLPELSDLDEATLKGIALLTELNDWNDTRLDVNAQLAGTEQSLINNAKYLTDIAETVAEEADIVRAFNALLIGDEQGSENLPDASGGMIGVTELIGEFIILAEFIEQNHDSIGATFDSGAGAYNLSLNPTVLTNLAHLEDGEKLQNLKFFFVNGNDRTAEASVQASYKRSGNILTEIIYSGTGSASASQSAIELELLELQDSDSGTELNTFVGIDALIPADTGLLGQQAEISVSVEGDGSVDLTMSDTDELNDGDLDTISHAFRSADIFLGLTISEIASEATEAGYSPAEGSVSLSIDGRRNEDNEPEADAELTVNVSNEAGETIEGTLTYLGVRELEQGYQAFEGELLLKIDDSEHEFDGAEVSLKGKLELRASDYINDDPGELTASAELEAKMSDGSDASIEFQGNITLFLMDLYQSSEMNEEIYIEIGDTEYYLNNETLLLSSAALSGKLVNTLQDGNQSELDVNGALLIDNLRYATRNTNDDTPPDPRIPDEQLALDIGATSITYSSEENSVVYNLDIGSEIINQQILPHVESVFNAGNLIYEDFYFEAHWRHELKLRSHDCIDDHYEDPQFYFCPIEHTYHVLAGSFGNVRDFVEVDTWYTDIEFTAAEYNNGMASSPSDWINKLSSPVDSAFVMFSGGFNFERGNAGYSSNDEFTWGETTNSLNIGLSYTYLDEVISPREYIVIDEAINDFTEISANFSVDLSSWGYDDAAIQIAAERTGLEDFEAELLLSYGARALNVKLDVADGHLNNSASQLTISNTDTSMSILADCASIADEEASDFVALTDCPTDDLDFSGTIIVDDVEVGRLEDRGGIPVFVFDQGQEYQLILTPNFLISASN